jgi:hypothetical protein
MPSIEVELRKDQIYYLPYDSIKVFLEKGEAVIV